MLKPTIKVYLVEDSAIASNILQNLLTSAAGIEVVGTADNGATALTEIPRLQPDVVCTDLQMPRMDGWELIRQLLRVDPRPILVLSEAVQPDATATIERLLEAGAVAVLAKPQAALRADYEKIRQTLIAQLRLVAGVKVIRKHSQASLTAPLLASPIISSTLPSLPTATGTSKYRIIAIGASTGGPQAVYQLLKVLPSDYSLPILCTQHISKGFLSGLVDWQNRHCALRVKIAEAREYPIGGCVYYAPDDVHLILDSQGRLAFSSAPPVQKHRPSVTTMFEAVAHHYQQQALGVLLTGMGEDGAQGLGAIAQAGGLTLAQDEASSVVFGMPKVAIERGAAQHILSPPQMGTFLCNLGHSQ